MRTDNLFTALLLLAFATILLYLLIQLIHRSWKRKYFPTNALTTAHAAALGGQMLSAAILAIATLFPLKDYLNLVSATEHLNLSSGPLWGLLLICALSSGIAYLLAMAFAKILVQSFFKGKSIAVELQENNLVYGLLYAATTLAFALAFLLPVIVLIQGFVPMPSIPNIR
jgi:TRAP-type C4-dicarboxylate transport system permease small subunit